MLNRHLYPSEWISVTNYGEIACTVIRFVSISAKFCICTVVGVSGTLVKAKMRTFMCLKIVF